MTTLGMIVMIVSNVSVLSLAFFCFYRVLHTPEVEKHEHALLEIDTGDEDAPSGHQ